MRIRQVKPSFWSDSTLAGLSEAVRLFYIGLWMEADDAGWFRWDPAEIAHDLYGYEGRARRERRVETMFAELRDAGRLRVLECGHVEIPKLAEHQHLAGSTKQVRTAFNEHLRRCSSRVSPDAPQIPAGPRDGPHPPAPVRLGSGQVREGQERSVKVGAQAREMEEPTEFERLVPRDLALGGRTA